MQKNEGGRGHERLEAVSGAALPSVPGRLMSGGLLLLLFGGGAVFAVLSAFSRKGRSLFSLLAALCAMAGLLAGLALGRTLEDLLPPLALVCAASLTALYFGRGEER